MSNSKDPSDFEEEEPLRVLETIKQKCEKQKGLAGYDKKYRKQVKEKLRKLKKQLRGEKN